jgi:hypothetical protein
VEALLGGSSAGPPHPFAVSPPHPFVVSPAHPFVVSPAHPFVVSPAHPFVVSPLIRSWVSPPHPFVVSLSNHASSPHKHRPSGQQLPRINPGIAE